MNLGARLKKLETNINAKENEVEILTVRLGEENEISEPVKTKGQVIIRLEGEWAI